MSDDFITERAEALHDWLVAVRRKIHQNPELSFKEFATADLVASELEKMAGMKVIKGKETGTDTGVIGMLSAGIGPTIALRADLDALPIVELNDHEYKSKRYGVMHACGHDAHTTIVLGAAKLFAELFKQGQLTGTVKFIFQPAEEATDETGSTGAQYIVKSGAIDDVQAILALHMDPELPVGEIKLHEGYSMASNDSFSATIHGSGGHAAYPEQCVDPVWMLSHILPKIYSIPTRKISALDAAVISITSIETNQSYNVIPDQVQLQGTMRSYDDTVRYQLEKELEAALAMSTTFGGTYQLFVGRGEPALFNDKRLVHLIEATVQEHMPTVTIHHQPYGMGSEDFSHMTRHVPGAMFFIGSSSTAKHNRGLHMPDFDIDEQVLPLGVSILACAGKKLLNRQEGEMENDT